MVGEGMLLVQGSENGILSRIIKLFVINHHWRICSFPFNSVLQRFVQGNRLAVSQLLSYTRGIGNKMLVRIDLLCQVSREVVCGYSNSFPSPPCKLCDLAYPFGHSESVCLANIVDAIAGAFVGHGQCNGGRDILNIPVRPAPPRLIFAKQDGGPPVIYALEEGEQAVLGVALAIHQLESLDNARQPSICPYLSVDA